MHRNRQRCRWFSPAKYWGLLRSGEGVDKIVCRGMGLPWVMHPTPLGCVELIDRAGSRDERCSRCRCGRSNIVGLPVATMLLHRNATVTCCHSRTKDHSKYCDKRTL